MRKYNLEPLVIKRVALAILILELVLWLVFIVCMSQNSEYGFLDHLLNLWFWLFAGNLLLIILLIIKKPTHYGHIILALILVPPVLVIASLFLIITCSGVTC